MLIINAGLALGLEKEYEGSMDDRNTMADSSFIQSHALVPMPSHSHSHGYVVADVAHATFVFFHDVSVWI